MHGEVSVHLSHSIYMVLFFHRCIDFTEEFFELQENQYALLRNI